MEFTVGTYYAITNDAFGGIELSPRGECPLGWTLVETEHCYAVILDIYGYATMKLPRNTTAVNALRYYVWSAHPNIHQFPIRASKRKFNDHPVYYQVYKKDLHHHDLDPSSSILPVSSLIRTTLPIGPLGKLADVLLLFHHAIQYEDCCRYEFVTMHEDGSYEFSGESTQYRCSRILYSGGMPLRWHSEFFTSSSSRQESHASEEGWVNSQSYSLVSHARGRCSTKH